MGKFNISNLDLYYTDFHALKNVNLDLPEKEITAFIGPSGCGKSTLLKSLNRMNDLVEGCKITGEITLDGVDIYKNIDVNLLRKRVGMVFQKPNPFPMSIYDNIAYGPRTHGIHNKSQLDDIVEKSLRGAAIWDEVKDRLKKSALGMSGGQQQRLCIARALAVNPQFIVCDEPISALDVSIQAQVVNMFEELQEQMGLTYLFIAHDLSVVKHISDRIGVMYLGKMVELADSYELVARSLHPYTKSLISAIPIADPIKARASKRIVLQGDVPSPLNPPTGCRFRTRCPYADECCAQKEPEWREVEKGHYVACHHVEKINA